MAAVGGIRSAALLLLMWAVAAQAGEIPNWAGKHHSEILKELTLGYRNDHHREARGSSECNTKEGFVGNCAADCQCVDGKWSCCRVRKSVEHMSDEEMERFSSAFVTVASNPRYLPAFKSLIWSHAVFACTISSRTVDIYDTEVGFHNLLMFALENLLRLVDCRVTVPYWDVAMSGDKVWADILPKGLGGDGVGSKGCVKDGPLRENVFTIPKLTLNNTKMPFSPCLQRSASKTTRPFPYQLFQTLMTIKPERSILFESGIFEEFDANFHYGVGGTFIGLTVAVDPLFYLLHNFANKVIANYQMQGPEHLTGGGRWNNTKKLTTFPWFEAKDWMHYYNFPNDVCIRWDASLDREKAIATGYYIGLEVPRADHLTLPYKEVREMPIGSKPMKTFSTLLKFYHKRFKTFQYGKDGLWLSPDWKKDIATLGYFSLKNDPNPPLCHLYERIAPDFLATNSSVALVELI